MNIYRFNFIVRCPMNRKFISYVFELRKPDSEKVQVEHIQMEAALYETAFHEQLADVFFERFGGQQILKAHHHGVDIETQRGFEAPDSGRLKERVVIGKTVFEKGVEARLVVEAVTR